MVRLPIAAAKGLGRKLYHKWRAPYKIVKLIGVNATVIPLRAKNPKVQVYHLRLIAPFKVEPRWVDDVLKEPQVGHTLKEPQPGAVLGCRRQLRFLSNHW